MIKIYNNYYNSANVIKSCDIIDNNVCILLLNKLSFEIRLIKIDLLSRKEIFNDIIVNDFNDVYDFDNIIIVKNILYLVSYNNSLYYKVVNSKNPMFKIDSVKNVSNVFNINNELCCIINSGFNNCELVNIKGECLLKIKINSYTDIIYDDNTLYLPYYLKYIIYNNDCIFFYFYGQHIEYVMFNLKTKDIKYINIKYYIYNILSIVNTNKIFYFNYSDNEVDVDKFVYNVETKESTKINDDVIYIKDIMYNNVDYDIELTNVKLNIYIDYHITKYINCDCIEIIINDEILPKEYISKRSEYLSNLFKDNNDIEKLNHEQFNDIKIYKEYILNNEIINLMKLFKICNYLIDKDINYLSELIIIKVKDECPLIEAFEYLKLLSTSICDNQLNILFYIILRKYNKNDIVNIISSMDINENEKLYKFIISELVSYSII